MVSPSSSGGDSIKNDIVEELDKGLNKVIDEGFELLYQLGTEIMEKVRVNNNIFNNDQITEVAQTKQTAHKQPAQGCSSQQEIRVSPT